MSIEARPLHRWLKSLSLLYLAPFLLHKHGNLGSVLLLSAEELDAIPEDLDVKRLVKHEMMSIIHRQSVERGTRGHLADLPNGSFDGLQSPQSHCGRVHPGDETQAASDKLRHDMDVLRAAVSRATKTHIAAAAAASDGVEGAFTVSVYRNNADSSIENEDSSIEMKLFS